MDELKELEKHIAKEYGQASRELQEKWDKYINGWDEGSGDSRIHHKSLLERYKEEYQAYQEGKYTKEQFDAWYYAQIGRGERWQNLKDQMSSRMTEAKQSATSLINNVLPKAYTKSFNDFSEVERVAKMSIGQMGIRWDLVDEYTIKNLMLNKNNVTEYRVDYKFRSYPQSTLRPLAINPIKDYEWNSKMIQNALLQGILQGESIGKIANRFQDVMVRNRNSAIRNARTAVTGARNRGKLDRWGDLKSQGCEMTKIWVALGDDRVRDWHADADGQEVPYDEPFIVGGEEMECPCDSYGSPRNVYNCRCQMKLGKIKFKPTLSDEQRSKIRIY